MAHADIRTRVEAASGQNGIFVDGCQAMAAPSTRSRVYSRGGRGVAAWHEGRQGGRRAMINILPRGTGRYAAAALVLAYRRFARMLAIA